MASTLENLRLIGSELNPKRRPRVGLDAWYPYYAGFSEDFARSVLSKAQLAPGATVLDPWNGSGTTTHVADHLGFRAVGFDINPVATLVANAKLARPKDAEHVSGLARRIVTSTAERGALSSDEPLNAWLSPSAAQKYRSIESAIIDDLATDQRQRALVPSEGLPPLASFLLLALMRAARTLAAVDISTNPTWVRPGKANRGTGQLLGARWLETVQQMASELSLDGSVAGLGSEAAVADARQLPLNDASVDFVLTSPPYCTRIDYVVSTAFELAALGIARSTGPFSELRKRCMGAPIIRDKMISDPSDTWAPPVRSLLRRIKRHPSRDSASYYYKTYWQYFDDCDRALRELHRTLRPGAAAVLVVQSSYYKDVRVDLPRLYVAMGEARGFQTEILGSVEVRHSLTQINSRSLRHRETTRYREAVVALEKIG